MPVELSSSSNKSFKLVKRLKYFHHNQVNVFHCGHDRSVKLDFILEVSWKLNKFTFELQEVTTDLGRGVYIGMSLRATELR